MNNRDDGVTARIEASGDVRRAFQAFLSRIDAEQPFILVGMGQGGLHGLSILINDIAPFPEIRRRLVVAYIHETPVPLDIVQGPLVEIPPCDSPESIRCLHAFVSARSDNVARIRIVTEDTVSWTADGELERVTGRGLLCVNPILGSRTSDYAPARLHLGGADATGFRTDSGPAPLPAQTGAQCIDGMLMTEEPRSRTLHRANRLAENYRLANFNLFYEDIRADVERRVESFLPIFETENQLAPPLAIPEEIENAPVIAIPDRAGN